MSAGLLARYDADEAFRARITDMYLNERPRFIVALISLAYELGATRREAVDFSNAVTSRIKADLRLILDEMASEYRSRVISLPPAPPTPEGDPKCP